MYRMLAASLFLVASTAASCAQGLAPSVWKGQQGAILKVLNADSATGNFSGVFISGPSGPCPGVPYDLAGRIRGPRAVFQTSRTWTSDCSVTAVWSGHLSARRPLRQYASQGASSSMATWQECETPVKSSRWRATSANQRFQFVPASTPSPSGHRGIKGPGAPGVAPQCYSAASILMRRSTFKIQEIEGFRFLDPLLPLPACGGLSLSRDLATLLTLPERGI